MYQAQHQDKPMPPPYPAYVVQVEAPAAAMPQGDYIKTGEWEEGLCGCCSSCVPNCCMVSFCPCVSVAQVAKRLRIAPYIVALLASFLSIFAGVGILHCIFVWQLRSKTRDLFQIPGSCCGDCCAATFCSCCALAQVASHVKSYEPGACDFGPPDTLPGFR